MPALRHQERSSKLWLLLIGALSLFVTYAANNALSRALPHLAGIGSSCIASVAAAALIYTAIRPSRPLAWALPTTPWHRMIRLSIVWLVSWLIAASGWALLHGEWQAYVVGGFAILGFTLLGPLTEELLFRGAVFELAERSFPAKAMTPILISTVLFSAYHLQLHGFRLSPFLLLQLMFTLPMGFVFATLRHWSGSLWPGLLVHILTNIPHAFGSPPSAA
jgi:membrane protease YdiL (CAAX protease family)